MTEVWCPAFGFEDRYEVSSIGCVRNVRTGNILQGRPNKKGYWTVCLWRRGKKETIRIHRLVAFTFVGIPKPDEEVNHIDGVRANNRVENLEWCTAEANKAHAFRLGRFTTSRKLTFDDVEKIKRMVLAGTPQRELAEEYGVTSVCISFLVRGLTYDGKGYIPPSLRPGGGRRRQGEHSNAA